MSRDPNFQIWARTKALSSPFWKIYGELMTKVKRNSEANHISGSSVYFGELDTDLDEYAAAQSTNDSDPENCETIHIGESDIYLGDLNFEADENVSIHYSDDSGSGDCDSYDFHEFDDYDSDYGDCDDPRDNGYIDEEVNPEYLEFIKVTRQHQSNREKRKKLEAKNKPVPEEMEYYKDISQVDTLVEDNLVAAPDKQDTPNADPRQRELDLIKSYGSQDAYEKIRSIEMYIDENFAKMCQKYSPRYWPAIPINLKSYLKNQDS